MRRLNWFGFVFTMAIVMLGAAANKSVSNIWEWLVLIGIGFIFALFPLIAGRKPKGEYFKYKCSCNPSVNKIGLMNNQICVPIPEHMADYRNKRVAEGLSDQICVDKCVFDEIEYLWSLGITTYGCCCGHRVQQSMVNVADKDIQKMLDMGYKQNHTDKTRKDTFRLKSVG